MLFSYLKKIMVIVRSQIFTRAADLMTTKYRLPSLAATMAGQVCNIYVVF